MFNRKIIITIFLLAFALRIILLLFLYSTPTFFNPDYVTDHWDNISRNILSGRGFSWVEDGSVPTIARSPVYAVFLAGLIKLTGGNFLIMRVLYMLLDSMIVILVLKLSYSVLADRAAALCAALFYAVYLFPAWHAAKFAPDTFLAFIMLVQTLLFLKLLRSVDSGTNYHFQAVVSGIAFGTALLTKKTVLLLPPVLILIVILKSSFRRKILWMSAIWLLVIAATISPWLYRNYKISGGLVITQTLTWFNYWYGEFMDENVGKMNMEEMHRNVAAYIEDVREEDVYLPYGLPPKEDLKQEVLLKQKALANIKGDFGHFLGKMMRNLLRFWYLTESSRVIHYSKIAGFMVFTLFALGVALIAKSRRFDLGALVLLATILYFNFIYAPIFAIARYIIPVLPYIAVFAGVSIAAILGWTGLHRRHPR